MTTSVDVARALPRFSPDVIAKQLVLAAAVLAATVASSSWAARANELGPLQAVSLRFGDTTGVAYYTVQGASYHVVATLAAERGTPLRFEGNLLSGQKLIVSIPDSAGAKAQTIELLRQGNRLRSRRTRWRESKASRDYPGRYFQRAIAGEMTRQLSLRCLCLLSAQSSVGPAV